MSKNKIEKNNEADKTAQKEPMSDKEELIDDQETKSSEHKESRSTSGPEQKEGISSSESEQKSSENSKKEKSPSDSEQSSNEREPEQSSSKGGEHSKSKESGTSFEDADEQAEFLKKQQKLLFIIKRTEKEQAILARLHPCDSCEFPDPVPDRFTKGCWRFCPAFLRRRKMPKEFWIVSVPGDPDRHQTFVKLNETMQSRKLSVNYKFHIPELKVGPLDELMLLTDELKDLDNDTEDIIRKLVKFMCDVLEGSKHLHEFFEVNHLDLATYITRFTWNPAKYPTIKPLPTLQNIVNTEVQRLSGALKVRMDEFHDLENNLDKIEKQHSGNLTTRSLSNIVKKKHFVLNSEYLTTVVVVVPNDAEKRWMETYQSLADMVVPNSSTRLFQDETHSLYNVTLCKKFLEDYKANASSQGFFVRDFQYREKEIAEEKDIRKKLRNLKETQISMLYRWIKANFSDVFSTWIHIKAMRVFVESILRYGLPSNFQAILLVPLKNKEQIKEKLFELYQGLDSRLSSGKAEDVPGTLTSFGVTEYFPYVFLEIKIDMFEQ